MLGKIVNRRLNGLARRVLPYVILEQLHIDRIRSVIILLRPLLERKMVHLHGIDFHGKHAAVQACSHAFSNRRLAAAGWTTQPDNKYLSRRGCTAHIYIWNTLF